MNETLDLVLRMKKKKRSKRLLAHPSLVPGPVFLLLRFQARFHVLQLRTVFPSFLVCCPSRGTGPGCSHFSTFSLKTCFRERPYRLTHSQKRQQQLQKNSRKTCISLAPDSSSVIKGISVETEPHPSQVEWRLYYQQH